MLINSISQIVEYNLVDDIADTVIKQVLTTFVNEGRPYSKLQ